MKNVTNILDIFIYEEGDKFPFKNTFKSEIEKEFNFKTSEDFLKILNGVPLNSINKSSLIKIKNFLLRKNEKKLSSFIKKYLNLYKGNFNNYKLIYVVSKTNSFEENAAALLKKIIKEENFKKIKKKEKNFLVFETKRGDSKILYRKRDKIFLKPLREENFYINAMDKKYDELYDLELLEKISFNKNHILALLKINNGDIEETLNDLIQANPNFQTLCDLKGKKYVLKLLKKWI